ncbi:MAG: Hsp20/alpha crystallin family protein [Patescibacteria group bacterium]
MARWMVPWFSMDEELNKFFDDPFSGSGKNWMTCPAADVFEKDGKVFVRFDLPGVKEDEVDVEIGEKYVEIKGESKEKKEVKDKKYYRLESRMSSFSRRVPVPSMDAKKAEAVMKDGVLEIRAPKIEAEKLTTKLKVKKLSDSK